MKKTTAEILTIGDEILYGQITDTNSQFISSELDKAGIFTIRKTSVGDDKQAILTAFAEAESRADLIITTGGLGPTKDDITKNTFCEYFNSELVIHEPTLALVTDFFAKRGRELTELNRKQAEVPAACEVIINRMGTAPCMWFNKGEKVFISLPGVPFEMRALVTDEIIPRLKTRFKTASIVHKMVHTSGIGESFLAQKIEDWEDALPRHIKLAYLPSIGLVKLRLTAWGDDRKQLEAEVDAQIDLLKPIIKDYIFGFGEQSKQELVIGNLMKEKGLTLAIAESCTGGYLSHLFTLIPGASAYFKGSVVAYSNAVKTTVLKVPEAVLAAHGAVSEETIKLMAANVRDLLGSDIGIATSGIAGPDGGTPEKPVGTIWLAVAFQDTIVTKMLSLASTRELNIQLSSVHLLNLLRQSLAR